MKIRVFLSLLLTGLLSTAAFAGLEPAEGEKLITFQPDPEIWEIANKDLINSKRLVWFNKEMRSKGKTFNDFYEVNVFNKPKKKNLDEVREWSDRKGSLKCQQFDSTNLSRNVDGSYPSVSWSTVCQRNKAPAARLITKLIEGENHLYQVQKAWIGEVDPEAIRVWQQHIEEAYVCNINSESEPCPPQPAEEAMETPDEDPLAAAVSNAKDE